MDILVKSPFVHRVKNIQEVENCYFSVENSTLFTGGTHLMHHDILYPKTSFTDIIDLYSSKFLTNIVKGFDFLEIECNCRLQALAEENQLVPDLIRNCLNSGIPFSVRELSSVAGAVYNKKIYYDLAACLVALKALCDIKYQEDGKKKQDRILLETLYQLDEKDYHKVIIEKFTIAKRDNSFNSFYKKSSSSFFHPEKSVVIAGSYSKNVYEDEISKTNFAVCYADRGCKSFQETASMFNENCNKILNSSYINKIRASFEAELEKNFPKDDRNLRAKLMLDDIIEDIQLKVL